MTTTGGDVKKIAGLKTWFTPITREVRDIIRTETLQLKKAWDERNATYDKLMKKHGNPTVDEFSPDYRKVNEEYRDYENRVYKPAAARVMGQAMGALEKQGHEVRTDGDGRFSLDIPPGKYLVWTDEGLNPSEEPGVGKGARSAHYEEPIHP